MFSKKSVIAIFIAFLFTTLAFQNCSSSQFSAFGNGDPHEGVDPGTESDLPGSGESGPGDFPSDDPRDLSHFKRLVFNCPVNTQEFDLLVFGIDPTDADTVVIGSPGFPMVEFPWNRGPGILENQLFANISPTVHVDVVDFTESTQVADIYYFVGSDPVMRSLSLSCDLVP